MPRRTTPIDELTRIFPGDGEQARRMRDFDWARTPLGPPGGWPERLRVALGLCLTSRFPMHLWWGPELTLLYNDACIPLLGRAKHPAVLGRSGREAWPEVWDALGPMMEDVRRTGVASGGEDLRMFVDRERPREEVSVTFAVSPVFGAEGGVDGLFCTLTESTEKRVGPPRREAPREPGSPPTEDLAEMDLAKTAFFGDVAPTRDARLLLEAEQQARASAEQASRLKDEFLARVSHELATPVAAMRMWLEVVRPAETVSPLIERAMTGLRQCVRAQAKTVEDLLDTARALTGKLSAVLEPAEPAPIVEAAVAAMRPAAEKKGLTLELSVGDTPLVKADAARLQQVLSNLLSNAVRFTPPGGGVRVRVGMEGGGLSIEVRDTGRGFAPEFQQRLFAPFRQEQEGTTRTTGGLGLGLAIARQLVELHGGWISGGSEGRDRGATFTVWLPGLAEEDDATEAGARESGGRRLEGVRVLLVDDDPQTRESVATVLEQHGARVESAESATRALAALRRDAFDVMLCDIAMPEEDGYSLIHKVRTLGARAARLPAAAFTAHMRAEDTRRAMAAGFQMHIPKSTEPAQLIDRLLTLSRGASSPTA
ncbi:response regulator [Pyxidicoccus fallax]|uniref:histidine kinase n=1 Tax=Pyxidicoccus fallax TaxID=394095 RepID=A0A848LCC9_9BACT|nr:ATP-binding protein [Pyxidicoccus fallax]NMO16136.1 response regulator [Pyxidicoccus fallax]NPC83201.1 response regulator [Pyxidicoccus fallax]